MWIVEDSGVRYRKHKKKLLLCCVNKTVEAPFISPQMPTQDRTAFAVLFYCTSWILYQLQGGPNNEYNILGLDQYWNLIITQKYNNKLKYWLLQKCITAASSLFKDFHGNADIERVFSCSAITLVKDRTCILEKTSNAVFVV